MSLRSFFSAVIAAIPALFLWLSPNLALAKESLEFVQKLTATHGLSAAQSSALQRLFSGGEATRNIGTEDPNAIFGIHSAVHPASRQSCVDKVLKTGLIRPNPSFEKICGAKWMSPIPEGPGQAVASAKVCIDQFEFPDIPCEYPIVWSTSSFARQVCSAMGKRVCNSHEWEGACAGHIDTNNPYLFNLNSLQERRSAHNANREKVWAFHWSPELKNQTSRQLCAIYNPNDPDLDPRLQGKTGQYYTSIGKSVACQQTGSDYDNCGSHTWPSGMKYACSTENEVYDMHGNVAEVVSFPVSPQGIAGPSGNTDYTERKGSFFVVRSDYPDDCRVRQPYEHFENFASGGMAYYQEGFRCCKDIEP